MKKGTVMLVVFGAIFIILGCSKTGKKTGVNLENKPKQESIYSSKPSYSAVDTGLPVVSINPEDADIAEPTDGIKSNANLSIEEMNSAKSISDCSVVKSTIPADAAGETTVSDESNITILFQVDMDETTLISQNFVILEGKHGSIINDLFDFHYDAITRELHIDFKIQHNSVGTANIVNVFLTKSIKTSDGKNLDNNYVFTYIT